MQCYKKALKFNDVVLLHAQYILTHLLDFGEDDIYIGAGDVLAINNFAVFAQFSPVFPVHLLAGSFGVPMDGKLLKRLQQLIHVCAFCHIGYSAKQIVRP